MDRNCSRFCLSVCCSPTLTTQAFDESSSIPKTPAQSLRSLGLELKARTGPIQPSLLSNWRCGGRLSGEQRPLPAHQCTKKPTLSPVMGKARRALLQVPRFRHPKFLHVWFNRLHPVLSLFPLAVLTLELLMHPLGNGKTNSSPFDSISQLLKDCASLKIPDQMLSMTSPYKVIGRTP